MRRTWIDGTRIVEERNCWLAYCLSLGRNIVCFSCYSEKRDKPLQHSSLAMCLTPVNSLRREARSFFFALRIFSCQHHPGSSTKTVGPNQCAWIRRVRLAATPVKAILIKVGSLPKDVTAETPASQPITASTWQLFQPRYRRVCTKLCISERCTSSVRVAIWMESRTVALRMT